MAKATTARAGRVPTLRIRATGIDHVVLWVGDLARAKRFYVDVLGMRLAHGNSWQAFLWCGRQQVALFDARHSPVPVQPDAQLNHVALRIEPASYEAVKARLEAEGIEVFGRPGDPTCIYFNDPDGHRLQLLYGAHDG